MLRTLHTIGGFEHGHKRRWPLTPHTRELGQGAQAGLRMKATNTHTENLLHCCNHNQCLKLNWEYLRLIPKMCRICIISTQDRNNPSKMIKTLTENELDFYQMPSYIQATACRLLITLSAPLTDILTYSPPPSFHSTCQTSDGWKTQLLLQGTTPCVKTRFEQMSFFSSPLQVKFLKLEKYNSTFFLGLSGP